MNTKAISDKLKSLISVKDELFTFCADKIKEILESVPDNRISFVDDDGDDLLEDNVYVTYDGGNHPEYNSDAYSKVSAVYLENGKTFVDCEDCDGYSIERVNSTEERVELLNTVLAVIDNNKKEDEPKCLDIESLKAYNKDFTDRHFAMRNEAKEKLREIMNALPGKELLSENTLGWLLYANMSDEWIENTIHGIFLDKYNTLHITCDLDYDDKDNITVNDWSDYDRGMTWLENNHYVNINWPLTLMQVLTELENRPELLQK